MSNGESQGVKAQRMSMDQRVIMLNFMKAHPALGTGKFTSPDGAKHKARLLQELTAELNCCPSGATKTPDKWLKSWQDWRSDAKAKSAKIRQHASGTGGGPPSKISLTPLEEELLAFIGAIAVTGHNVCDPLLVEDEHALPTFNASYAEEARYTQVEDAVIIGEQIGENFEVPLSLSNCAPSAATQLETYIPCPQVSPSESTSSNEAQASSIGPLSHYSPSNSSSGSQSNPVCFRKRVRHDSTAASVCESPFPRKKRERRVTECSERGDDKLVQLAEEQAKLLKQQVELTQAQTSIQKEALEVQKQALEINRQQCERYAAAFEKIADAVCQGINVFNNYMSSLQSKQ